MKLTYQRLLIKKLKILNNHNLSNDEHFSVRIDELVHILCYQKCILCIKMCFFMY